jgi:hypothetical protein
LAHEDAAVTLCAVVGELAKRFVNAMVLFLAAVTFFLVPMGRRTLAQHVVAMFGTTPAREAVDACADAGRRMVAGILERHDETAPPAELEPAD